MGHVVYHSMQNLILHKRTREILGFGGVSGDFWAKNKPLTQKIEHVVTKNRNLRKNKRRILSYSTPFDAQLKVVWPHASRKPIRVCFRVVLGQNKAKLADF